MKTSPTNYQWPTDNGAVFKRWFPNPRLPPFDSHNQAMHYKGLMTLEFAGLRPRVIQEERVEQLIYRSVKSGGPITTQRWFVLVELDEYVVPAPVPEPLGQKWLRILLRRPERLPVMPDRIRRYYSMSVGQYRVFNEVIDGEMP